MKNIFLLLFLFCSLYYSCKRKSIANPDCTDRSRWSVKTLTDADADSVHYLTPASATVSDLIQINPQNKIGDNTERFGIEFNTYTLLCRIREYKLSADGDYHLVLMDLADPSKTMIGEIPDPACTLTQQSKHINEFIKARKDFTNSLLITSQPDTGIYVITGVAFFDKVHGQTGVAPFGIEIHPVLSIGKK